MSATICVVASEESPIPGWLAEAGFTAVDDLSRADAVVFTPDRARDPRVAAGVPRVACMLFAPDWIPETPGPGDHLTVVADAYASSARSLGEAVRFVLAEDRAGRARGPLRVTWLGALGTWYPGGSPPIGTSIPLAPGFSSTPFIIGRSVDATLCVRQGAHSDQNVAARRHVRLVATPRGATVRDLGSTNGTWLRGAQVESCEIVPGDELVIAGFMHVRLDGAAECDSPGGRV